MKTILIIVLFAIHLFPQQQKNQVVIKAMEDI